MHSGTERKRFVFLDRDGVINVERGDYTTNEEEWEWANGALEGIKLLTENQFDIIIITNQSCIGKGIQTEDGLEKLHAFMLRRIKKTGGKITDIYYCPHTDADHCTCRKPLPGMILDAAREHGIKLESTFFVGDSPRDISAGKNAGTRTVAIADNPISEGEEAIFKNLLEAARFIINETEKTETI